MNDKAVSSHKLFEELKKIINLPDNVKTLTLHLEIDTAATMSLTQYVEENLSDYQQPATETTLYDVVLREEKS